MELKTLLQFDSIVIQCHNDPDADAVASGFGIWSYLCANGKNPRLVYGGRNPIRKSNLVRMVERLEIPVEHVHGLEEEPELLLTVDCQPGERNVERLPGKRMAAIDHHITRKESLSGLWEREIRDNYGACATIVWDLLRKEKYDVKGNRRLAIALYYGLFMDTCKLQEICQIRDRAMRDDLESVFDQKDREMIDEFKTHNLSAEELIVVGQALGSCETHKEERFAIAKAEPCDPNLLGIISDQMLEVDTVDLCIAYCMLPGGAKLSIRSCSEETRASDLAAYLTGGGGHAKKAGGFLGIELLKHPAIDPEELDDLVGRFLAARMDDYFREQDVIRLDGGEYPDLTKEPLYQKKPVRIGYIKASDVYKEGTEVRIRMLEGDREEKVTEDLYFIVGVRQEVYVNNRRKLEQNNECLQEPYELPPEALQDVEDAVSAVNDEDKALAGHIFACVPKNSRIHACRLTRRTKVFQKDWEGYLLGEPGDYLAARAEEPSDIYIINEKIFGMTYEEVTENRG